jgi:penicillin amidase
VSYTARALLPLIAKDLWYSTPPAELGTQERARAHALELLASWDGNMNEHMPEPLIYAVWVNTLYRMMIQDELTTLAPLFTQVDPVFVERAFRDIEGAAIWCDIKQTSRTEDCATLSKRALDEAIIFLKEHYQNDLTALRWGDAHEAIHFNKTLGRTPVIKLFANLRQSVSGGPQTLNRTMGTGALSPDGYKTIHGATYRGIYDFSDPDSSLFVTSTGQSGHILSRHYDDLGQKWRRGEYIPMSLDVDLARAGGVGTTLITPLSRTEP